MLHGLLQPDLERQIADLERRAPRVPVRVRAIDDELLLPCPQSCAPLKHRLRQSNATARRAVLADPDASTLLRRVGAALGYASASEALSRLDQAREVATCYVAHAEDPQGGETRDEEAGATSEAGEMLTMEGATLT